MKSILIRAEDKNQWERRSTLVPQDLQKLKEEYDFKIFVEKSDKRKFKQEEFVKMGAELTDSMAPGEIIFGVKEIPEDKILDEKTYLFFSHTIKGQLENMSMLSRIIKSGSTLIDYEKITDSNGRRKVFFGPFAGDVGAIDILWLLAEKWKAQGHDTLFSEIRQALNYDSVADAKQKLAAIGQKFDQKPLPRELGPMVIGILGYGNVSQGAQRIFECFPHEYIIPTEIKDRVSEGSLKNDRIYLSVFKEENLVEQKDGTEFDLQDYYHHPQKYKPCFAQYLPYLSVLVNATYWEKRYPKFVTWADLEHLFKQQNQPRLTAIADITCDVNGSIECNVKTTDSGEPAYRVLPLQHRTEDGHIGEGIVLLAVDNLPAELPKDASEFFSKSLAPYVPGILKADFSKALKDSNLPPEIMRAVIVYKGRLTDDFSYLEEFLKKL